MPSNPPERIAVVEGDITTLDVDAIVNAANRHLEAGAGVCGAIHRAAGPELAKACARVGGCPTGEARLTPGFKLKARHVIHAVGPIWYGGDRGEDEQLASCYRRAVELCQDNNLESVAFPAISTGVFRFPAERAAKIAVTTTVKALASAPSLTRVIFCCFSRGSGELHQEALEAFGSPCAD